MFKKVTLYIKNDKEGQDVLDRIHESFYEKNSYEDLINKATNASAIDILSEKYAAANLKWQNAMDEMGKVILGEYYGDIDYNINVNFMKNTVDIDLDGDNPDYHSILEQMSHSDVYSVIYSISQR